MVGRKNRPECRVCVEGRLTRELQCDVCGTYHKTQGPEGNKTMEPYVDSGR